MQRRTRGKKAELWIGYLDSGQSATYVVFDTSLNRPSDQEIIYLYNLRKDAIVPYQRETVIKKLRRIDESERGLLGNIERLFAIEKARYYEAKCPPSNPLDPPESEATYDDESQRYADIDPSYSEVASDDEPQSNADIEFREHQEYLKSLEQDQVGEIVDEHLQRAHQSARESEVARILRYVDDIDNDEENASRFPLQSEL